MKTFKNAIGKLAIAVAAGALCATPAFIAVSPIVAFVVFLAVACSVLNN